MAVADDNGAAVVWRRTIWFFVTIKAGDGTVAGEGFVYEPFVFVHGE